MLLQVLVRLRCARAAACTGLVSRRWRGLWARLPGLTFRDIPVSKIKSALESVARGTSVSLLEIRPSRSMSSLAAEAKVEDARAKSLLLSATRFSPEEMVFILPRCPKIGRAITIALPCFGRATSIELDTCSHRITPPVGELPVLEMLSISGNIAKVDSLLKCCPRLRVLGITFRGAKPDCLVAELSTLEAAAVLGLTVSRLGIEFEGRHRVVDGPRFDYLLRAAARLAPHELLFTSHFIRSVDADLVCFNRTTSIEMNLYTIRFTQLQAGEFSALERLVLNGCTITDLVTMIIRCPRLRVLKVTADMSARDVTVHSASLEELELDVQIDTECQSIQVVTPLLQQLKLKVHGRTNFHVSILAPVVEKVSWSRTYSFVPLIFGFWWLQSLRLETIESSKHKDEEGLCSQLSRVHVLSMEIGSHVRSFVFAIFCSRQDLRRKISFNHNIAIYTKQNNHIFFVESYGCCGGLST
jgi:hypothetical protein